MPTLYPSPPRTGVLPKPFRPQATSFLEHPQGNSSMSMQFRPAVPHAPAIPPSMTAQEVAPPAILTTPVLSSAVPTQLNNPYQFQHVGHANNGLPSQHGQHFQFSHSVHQLPARPGQVGHSIQTSKAALPVPEFHPHPVIALLPRPLTNNPIPNTNYAADLGAPHIPLSSSYTFDSSAGAQLQVNDDASPHYQPTTPLQDSSSSIVGQPWVPAASQSITSLTPVQHSNGQSPAIATAAPAGILQPSTNEKLQTDWIEHTRNGKRYYYNKMTRLSTWEKPHELMTAIEKADASTHWKEYTSPGGKKYYYNRVTKQSKWLIPDELKIAREKVIFMELQLGDNIDSLSPASFVGALSVDETKLTYLSDGVTSSPIPDTMDSVGTASEPAQTSTLPELPLELSSQSKDQMPLRAATPILASSEGAEASVAFSNTNTVEIDSSRNDDILAPKEVNTIDRLSSGQGPQEALKEMASAGNIKVTSLDHKPIMAEPLVFENKREAVHAFKALLESANVGFDWTWDQAMRVIINDPRYGALRTLGERKHAFNEFVGQKKKQEADDRRARKKENQENFRKMLEESKELTSFPRWSKAVVFFENDERFKAVEWAGDREDIFEGYMAEVKKREKEKALEENRRNKMEYLNYLKSCDFIKASSQWRKVQDRLEADERCSRLEKIDRLDIFQEYIRDLEKEEDEQIKIRMEELRRLERRNRDEFRMLMEEHVAAGILTPKTHWRDYFMKVKDLQEFQAVSSNTSGSTAMELFEDVSEELQKQYHEDKARIKSAIKSRKITLSSNWTFEDLKAAINENTSSPPLVDINLKLVFGELLNRVKDKEKEAKRRKHLADDFYDLLCSLKDVTSNSKWEEWKQLLEDRQGGWYKGEDSVCKEIFEMYITELREKAKDKEREWREDKAKRDRELKERERKKRRRDKERDYEGKTWRGQHRKDGPHGERDRAEPFILEEENRSKSKSTEKHTKEQSSMDNFSADENDKDRSKNSHSRRSHDRKRSKRNDH
ncbi:pre-mRNA-processing protein 40A-like isoform X2 [Impatiens glandulifera]|uniref:pre-mRNA-processing protein 40A-like isoform X2 n=1 Tax=Impatiens glandulifera TaxID=253017 RepID=UPI001FB10069|nr:pre-mRNA-processing protein 40A-like isoform X2 [Impatiens glandulifera]